MRRPGTLGAEALMRFAPLLLLTLACRSDYDVIGETPVPPPPPPGPDASTRGERFWVAYMENLELGLNGPPTFSLLVTAEAETSVTVTLPQTGLVTDHVVPAGLTRLPLPNAVLYPEGSDVRGRQGILVETSEPVDLVAVHDRLYFSEASMILPEGELGLRYRVLAVPSDGSGRSGFIVVATEDGTTVEVTPSVTTLGAFPAGLANAVTLDAGETWQVQSLEDLSGSLVVSDAPVAVFGGGVDAQVECWATSHAWDQLLPTTRWGRDTLVVPLLGQGGDLVRIASDTDGTQVRIDCGEPFPLDAGAVAALPMTAVSRVSSSHPVAVGQLTRGGSCTASGLGDANLVITTPTALYRDHVDVWGPWGERGFTTTIEGREVVQGASTSVGEGRFAEASAEYSRARVVGLDGPMRGVGFGFGDFDAFTWNLGWECFGCATDLTVEPVCPE